MEKRKATAQNKECQKRHTLFFCQRTEINRNTNKEESKTKLK
jgi:hypothetical protein